MYVTIGQLKLHWWWPYN